MSGSSIGFSQLVWLCIFGVSVFWVMQLADRSRIKTYIEKIGGLPMEIHWRPFGYGWFGGSGASVYLVRYENIAGDTIESLCKTGLFSGVYFSQEKVITPAPSNYYRTSAKEFNRNRLKRAVSDMDKLKEENRILREENKTLRGEIHRLTQGDHS